jgi:hypothetical protein
MGSIAGARRTQSTFPAYLAAADAPDLRFPTSLATSGFLSANRSRKLAFRAAIRDHGRQVGPRRRSSRGLSEAERGVPCYSIGRLEIPVGSRPARIQPTAAAAAGMAITMRNRLLHGTWSMMSDSPPSSAFEWNHPASPT